jgi:hypothetical protein
LARITAPSRLRIELTEFGHYLLIELGLRLDELHILLWKLLRFFLKIANEDRNDTLEAEVDHPLGYVVNVWISMNNHFDKCFVSFYDLCVDECSVHI